ncbi:Zinc finger protein 431 [Lemmus lemmus]
MAVTYDDVHINFTRGEWDLLNPSQKTLYKDVMLEIYKNLTSIGYIWEDHNTEEHWEGSRRHARIDRNQNGEKKLSVYTHCVRALSTDTHLLRNEKSHMGEKCSKSTKRGTAEDLEPDSWSGDVGKFVLQDREAPVWVLSRLTRTVENQEEREDDIPQDAGFEQTTPRSSGSKMENPVCLP